MSVDFSSENVEARRQQNTFKVMKEKNFISSIWSFVNEGKIKIFSDEKNQREFLASRCAPKYILKEVIQLKRNDNQKEMWNFKTVE